MSVEGFSPGQSFYVLYVLASVLLWCLAVKSEQLSWVVLLNLFW